ncbi:hypothetical protein LCGC14_2203390, partial [marine sediment metagenome]
YEILWELWAAGNRGYIVIADYASEPDMCEGWSREITKHAILGPKYWESGSFLLPLIRCNPPSETDVGPPEELKIGTFGFASPVKRHHEIAQLALRLGIKALIISTMPNPWPGFNEGPHQGVPSRALDEIRIVAGANPDSIELVDNGYLTIPEVQKKLQECTHLVSAMDNLTANWGPSGSLRTMATVGRPLIALNSQRAAEVDATLVSSLDEITLDFLKKSNVAPSIDKIGDGLWAYKNLIKWIDTAILYNKQIISQSGGLLHV